MTRVQIPARIVAVAVADQAANAVVEIVALQMATTAVIQVVPTPVAEVVAMAVLLPMVLIRTHR